jgi:gluconate 2-dehydrogenase gamma chain
MHRRQFLTITVSSVGGALVYSLWGAPLRLQAKEKANDKTVRIPLKFFTEDEALDVGAAAARIFPADDSGPGAQEAGVVIYIDRQLAGPYGRDRDRYTQPPFEDGPPELGYQGKATPREIYREGLKTIAGLHNLTPEQQDQKLKQMEHTVFFSLLRTHTVEGMFCDPMHGGNANMIGWQMIGFPGPRMSYFKEIDQYYGRPFRPKPVSLAQSVGRPVRPSEEEL